MTKVQHGTALFLVLILLFVCAVVTILLYRQSCRKLACLTFVNLSKFQTKEIYDNTNTTYRALLSNGNMLLRAEVLSQISSVKAQQEINGRITRIKGIFETAPAPYPGEISDQIACGKEFTPTIVTSLIHDTPITNFTALLTSRLTYGACTYDQASYQGIFTLFYCPASQQVYQLELIVPKEEFKGEESTLKSTMQSIRCTGSTK